MLFLFVGAAGGLGSEPGWRTSWHGALYGYGNMQEVNPDSVLNPDNQMAAIPTRSAVSELRLSLLAEDERFRLSLRSIASAQDAWSSMGSNFESTERISQCQVKVRLSDELNVSAGREVLNWGAAQFRSPSSPFYFANGRSDPMSELTGIDVMKLVWTPDLRSSLQMGYLPDQTFDEDIQGAWGNSCLMKYDWRSDDWAVGIVAVETPRMPGFYGANGQIAANDWVLLYAEVGSSAQATGLESPADIREPFIVSQPGERKTSALVGTTYTLENGYSLSAEYLYEGTGYTAGEEKAYFQRAESNPGPALQYAPRLLGQHYADLVWQSNLMENRGFWRAMVTENLTDSSTALSGYGETTLTDHVSVFLTGSWSPGGERQENSALISYSVTMGLKLALPP